MAFNFNRVSPGDPAQTFAGLSKTIRRTAEAVGRLDDMAENERKAHDAHQRDLDSMFGVVGKGLTQENYERLVQEQNALAQKEGVIKAYENFSYLDSVDKERATIRLNAYQTEMKKHITAMSNATAPLDFDSAEEYVYFSLKDKVLGTDSTGNDVTMELDTMRTGEIVAMSHGLNQNRVAVNAAVEDMRHEQAIKSSEIRFQQKFNELLVMAERKETRPLLLDEFKNLSNEYFGYGVTNINTLQLNTVKAYAVNRASDSDEPLIGLQDRIDDVLDGLVLAWETRDGAGPFAAEGTDNFIEIENIRRSVGTILDARERANVAFRKAQDVNVEAELETFVLNSITKELADNDNILSPGFGRHLNVELLKQSAALGHSDPDSVIGNFDSVLSNLSMTSNELYLGEALHDVNFTDSVDELTRIEEFSYSLFKAGTISLDDYKGVLSATKPKKKELVEAQDVTVPTTALDRAYKEGGFGSSTVRTNIVGAAEDILKLNDIKDNIGTDVFPHYVTIFGEDNDQLVVNRIKAEQAWVTFRGVALKGGTLPAMDIVPISPEDATRLRNLRRIEGDKKTYVSGVAGATIDATASLSKPLEIPVIEDPNDMEAIQHNLNLAKQRALQYSQYLAMQRLLQGLDDKVLVDSYHEEKMNTGNAGRGRSSDYLPTANE